MKQTFKKAMLAAVAVGAMASMAPAHADVMAGAMVNMTNFLLKKSDGTTLDRSDFGFLTFTSSADQSATLNGVGPSNSAAGVVPINFAPICTGGACPVIAADAFPKLFAPTIPGNYSAADQLEAGAPITGLDGFAGAAHIANGSYTGLTAGSVEGSSNSNNNLNASIVFALAQAGGITASFDVDAYLQAAITANEQFPGFGTASYQMDFTLTNLSTNTVVWTFAPDLFGNGVKTVSLNAPLPVDIQTFQDTGGALSFSSTTPGLIAGQLYQFSARIQTNADALRVAAVPEPGSLGLAGVGLIAAALGFRRRKLVK